MSNQKWKFEESERWVRGFRNGIPLVDSKSAKLMIESIGELNYYFPIEDIQFEFLEESDSKEVSGYRGTQRFWHLRMGEMFLENAAWTYDPKDRRPDFTGYIAFKWSVMDHWFEEEEEIFYHPRNPYHRVDTIQSSRQVEVRVDGVKIAETNNPYLLFETNLPTRYYIPLADVRSDYLATSDKRTICPYKGIAHYNDVIVNGAIFNNIVWYYPDPIPEAPKLRGTLAFWPEKDKRIEIFVDSIKQ